MKDYCYFNVITIYLLRVDFVLLRYSTFHFTYPMPDLSYILALCCFLTSNLLGIIQKLYFETIMVEQIPGQTRMRVDASWCELQVSLAFDQQLASTRVNSHQLWAASDFDASQREFLLVWPVMRFAWELLTISFERLAVSTKWPKLLSVFLVNFRSLSSTRMQLLFSFDRAIMQVHAKAFLPTCINSHLGLTGA